jgi:hypothetical protein
MTREEQIDAFAFDILYDARAAELPIDVVREALQKSLSELGRPGGRILTLTPDVCGTCGCTRVLRVDPLHPEDTGKTI